MKIKTVIAALVLGGSLSLVPAGIAQAQDKIGVSLSPPVAGPGTTVEIRSPECEEAGTAMVDGKTVDMKFEDGVAWGQYTIPASMEAMDYEVEVDCGSKYGTAFFTVTSGGGAPAGDGGAASQSSDPAMIIGGGLMAAAMVGGVALLRRRRVSLTP